jgi:glutamate formiminotransferase/formiminotetrahydrofolate cyclodeaminase
MVANLSCIKKGWESRVGEFSPWAEEGQVLKDRLLHLVDEDTRAFDGIMSAMALPKETPEQKIFRKQALQQASKYATEIPFHTMQASYECLPLMRAMATQGNPNSLSDVAVGVLCIKTAVRGAWFNVLINAKDIEDREWAENMIKRAENLLILNHKECDDIAQTIENQLRG